MNRDDEAAERDEPENDRRPTRRRAIASIADGTMP